MKQFKMLLIGLINVFIVSALWGMNPNFEKSKILDIDELNSSFFDHDNPSDKPRERIIPVNQGIVPSFTEFSTSQFHNLLAPQDTKPKYKENLMSQSKLGSESSLDPNRFVSQGSLGSSDKQPIPQLQPPVRPVIFVTKPSKETINAVQTNQAPYFTNKLGVLIQSLPYFLSHDLDSDQTKKNALHILKMIQNQLIRKKENRECRTIIQNAMNRIENGFSSEPYIIKILNAYDQIKFPTNSIIQTPETSKLSILKKQLEQLKTQRMVFIEDKRKPTPEWLMGVKNLFRAITSDIILGLSQLKTIKTDTELENIKPSLLENINFMISSIEALDSTLKLGSERRLLLIRLHKFIRTFSLNSSHATINTINNWIKEAKKIKISTLEKIENPDTLETSSLLMQKAEVSLETQKFRAKRKPILQRLKQQNVIIQKATAKSRISKKIDPKYIDLLMERVATLNEYLRLISPDEEELKEKIKNDILDDLDRISIYTIKAKNLLAYPFFKNPSNTKQYFRHPEQYFIDVDKNIANNDLESLKNTFGEFSRTRMAISSNLPQWRLLTLEESLKQKKSMFDKFLDISKDDELCALIPQLLNQIYTYKQLTGLGEVSAKIVQSNKEMINSMLERSLIKKQSIGPSINLIKDIIENTPFTEIDRQACLMLSYAILEKTNPIYSAKPNSFYDAINKKVNTDKGITAFNMIDEIAGNYYQKQQLKTAIDALTTLAALLPALALDLSQIPNEQLEDYSIKAEQLQNQFAPTSGSRIALAQVSKKMTQEVAERRSKNVLEKLQKVLNQSSSDEDYFSFGETDNPSGPTQQEQDFLNLTNEELLALQQAVQSESFGSDESTKASMLKSIKDEEKKRSEGQHQVEKAQASSDPSIPTEEPTKRDPHSGHFMTTGTPQISVAQETIKPQQSSPTLNVPKTDIPPVVPASNIETKTSKTSPPAQAIEATSNQIPTDEEFPFSILDSEQAARSANALSIEIFKNLGAQFATRPAMKQDKKEADNQPAPADTTINTSKQSASSGFRSFFPSWINSAIDWISSFFTTGPTRI